MRAASKWRGLQTEPTQHDTGQECRDDFTAQSDTIVEWNLSDQNGDGFPDLHVLNRQILECELDATEEPITYRTREPEQGWRRTHAETLAIDACPAGTGCKGIGQSVRDRGDGDESDIGKQRRTENIVGHRDERGPALAAEAALGRRADRRRVRPTRGVSAIAGADGWEDAVQAWFEREIRIAVGRG